MMTECGVCGKRIVIPYPEFYVYKREGTYFCSLDCMVVFKTQLTRQRCGFQPERNDKEMKQHRLTHDQKKKAIEIAIQGGDFMEYLKKCGAKNPSAAWWYIRETLAKADPEKYRELIGALATMKPEKEIKWQHDDPQVVGKVVKKEETAGGLEVTIEKAEKLPPEAQTEKKEPLAEVQTMPKKEHQGVDLTDGVDATVYALLYGAEKLDRALKKDLEYKVIGIETKKGKFQYDHASDQMRWMPRNSTVVIMMQSADWKQLAEDLPKIMATIGADIGEDDEDGEE